MSRRVLIDIVCSACPRVLARENDDGSWSVKIDEPSGGQWRTITKWQERFVCPDCKTRGYVDSFDMIVARRDRRRVRVPMRRLV